MLLIYLLFVLLGLIEQTTYREGNRGNEVLCGTSVALRGIDLGSLGTLVLKISGKQLQFCLEPPPLTFLTPGAAEDKKGFLLILIL